jgi:RHS repeat-associated protein
MGTNSYGYAYDAIGNRVFSAVNAVTNTYTANSLNQYTAVGSVSPVYDADGNMRWDGRMWHTWDAENRLTRSEPGWDGATNGAVMVDNRYDYRHRRCSKTVRRLTGRGAGYPFDPSQGGTWDVVETRTFIYDGWNLTAEVVVDAQAGTTNVTRYLWGPDVSGTLQGAGGVGGLLAVIRSDGTFFPCYDANGNVTDYVDGAGNIRAHYEYSPFGETIAQSGDLADTFKFRFSTKYWDEETRSYYYGYRFYSPELMRWLNRDPIGDRGGLNEYGFVGNAPMNRIDRLGLFPLTRDLEIELDYQKVPVRKNENVTLFAKTWARGPDIFETTDAEIVREGKCCARVKRASKRKMVIRAHWLSEDAIGRFVTAKGYDVIIEHEQKRDGALIAGFTAYYGPVSGLGAEATKCGKVCRKGGFKAAKWALEDYLGTIASDAWSQFYDYSIRAQGDIERENRFGNAIFVMQNGNLLFDGHRNS